MSVVIIYDTGSEVTLCNDETGPMITNTKEERMRITISTINSEQTMLKQTCKLNLNNDQTIEAVKIPNMNFRLQPQIIPNQWQDLEGAWANQGTYGDCLNPTRSRPGNSFPTCSKKSNRRTASSKPSQINA